MTLFAVTLTDSTTDMVEDADAYQQEGPMTTFFAFGSNRQVIDSWSTRIASYRTADIAAIRRGPAVDSSTEGPFDQATANNIIPERILISA